MEDLLECSICMDAYNDTKEKTPKVLQCQHTFCFECLQTLHKKKKIRCPTCRDECRLSPSNLQTNLTLVQLLDVRKEMADDNKVNAECQACHKISICATTTDNGRLCHKCYQKILVTKRKSAEKMVTELTEKLAEAETKADDHDKIYQSLVESVEDFRRQADDATAVKTLLGTLDVAISNENSDRTRRAIEEGKKFLSSSEGIAKKPHVKGTQCRSHEIKLDHFKVEARGRIEALTVQIEEMDAALGRYDKIKKDLSTFKPRSTKNANGIEKCQHETSNWQGMKDLLESFVRIIIYALSYALQAYVVYRLLLNVIVQNALAILLTLNALIVIFSAVVEAHKSGQPLVSYHQTLEMNSANRRGHSRRGRRGWN